MDTNIVNVDQSQYLDLFGGKSNQSTAPRNVRFGSEEGNFDLVPPTSLTETATLAPSVVETTTIAASTNPDNQGQADTDLLKQKEQPQNNETPLAGVVEYFSDRIKAGKFVKIQQEDEQGNAVDFIPKTAEEFDEVIDLQINYKLEQQKKDLEQRWYSSKSPAWQAVSKYAEMVDDPTELIPFLQGVRNLQSVDAVNETELDGAEFIVRTRLEQRGEPADLIEQQIDALKTTDKLISTAKQYKPLMIEQERQHLSRLAEEEKQRTQQYFQQVDEIRDKAITAIQSPIFGTQRLKQEEKEVVFDLIGMPSQETQGYKIFNAIDNLFEKRDFETLTKVALLLAKTDSFMTYVESGAANKTAASLEKKLRVSGDRNTGGGDQDINKDAPVVSRNQFSRTPRFGK